MNIIKPVPPEVFQLVEDFVRRSGDDGRRHQQALDLAKTANEIVQRVGAIMPATAQEAIDNFLKGPHPAQLDSHPLGVCVQYQHTTTEFGRSRFHKGFLHRPQQLIGYSSLCSRHGVSMGLVDDSGPLQIINFWGLFGTIESDGTGAATPLLGLMEKVSGNSYAEVQKAGTDNIRRRWGLQLSEDGKNPGNFVAITDWRAE